MTTEQGHVVNIYTRPTGSETVADHTLGATLLLLDNSYPFNTNGGELLIDDDAHTAPISYSSADQVADSITLSTPLIADVLDGTKILVYPEGEEKWAQIDLRDRDEGIQALVPYGMVDKFPDGIREEWERESVFVSDDSGRWEITAADQQIPVVDGGYIDPGTLPPSLPGFPEAPVASPTPVVYQGSGAAVVKWEPVPDATGYNLYVNAVDASQPIDTTTLYAEDVSNPIFVTNTSIDGSGSPLEPGVTFYFALVAVNNQGVGPPSAWVEGTAGTVNSDILSASLAIVQGVITELVETAGLEIGNASWNGQTGLTIPNVVNFPPDDATAAQVWAHLIARSMTVENYFKLQGTVNEITAGASLTLAEGITDPDTPPSMAPWWEIVHQLNIPEGTDNIFGLVVEDANTVVVGRKISDYECEVIRLVDGDVVARIMGSGAYPYFSSGESGICRNPNNGNYLICDIPRRNIAAPNQGFFRLNEVSADLSTRIGGRIIYTTITSSPGVPGDVYFPTAAIFAFSSTYFGIGGRNVNEDEFTIHIWDWNTPDQSLSDGRYSNQTHPISGAFNTRGISGFGKPPGNSQLDTPFVNLGEGWTLWTPNDPVLYDGVPVPRAYGANIRGAFFDGTHHYTVDSTGRVVRYAASAMAGEVGFTYRDSNPAGSGEHETAVSPPATIAAPRGGGITVTPPPPPFTGDPDSPDVNTVYARLNSGLPWREQGDATPSLTLPLIDASAPIYGSRPSFVAGGLAPALIRSTGVDPGGVPWINLDADGNIGNDSGVLSASGANYSGSAQFQRFGRVVFASISLAYTGSGTPVGFVNVGITVPLGLRPAVDAVSPAFPMYAGDVYQYVVRTTGVVQIRHQGAATLVRAASWNYTA